MFCFVMPTVLAFSFPVMGQVLHKTEKLIECGVTEKEISACIVDGTDPYDLGGSTKSVYKCAYQFLARIKLARIVAGDLPLPPDADGSTYKEFIESLAGVNVLSSRSLNLNFQLAMKFIYSITLNPNSNPSPRSKIQDS